MLRTYLQRIASEHSNDPIKILKILINDYLKPESKSDGDKKIVPILTDQNSSLFTCTRIAASKDNIETIIKNILNEDKKLAENLETNEKLADLFRAFFCYHDYLTNLLSDELKCRISLLSQLFTQKDYLTLIDQFDHCIRTHFHGESLANLLDHLPQPQRDQLVKKLIIYGERQYRNMSDSKKIEFARAFSFLKPKEQKKLLDTYQEQYQHHQKILDSNKEKFKNYHCFELLELLSYCINLKPEYLKGALLECVLSFLDQDKQAPKVIFNIISLLVEPLISTEITLPQRLKLLEKALQNEPKIHIPLVKHDCKEHEKNELTALQIRQFDTVYRGLFELLKSHPKEVCELVKAKYSKDTNPIKGGGYVLWFKLRLKLPPKDQESYPRPSLKTDDAGDYALQMVSQNHIDSLVLRGTTPEIAALTYDGYYQLTRSSTSYSIYRECLKKSISLLSPAIAYEKLVAKVENYSSQSAGFHLLFLERHIKHFPKEACEKFINERLLPYIEKTIGAQSPHELKAAQNNLENPKEICMDSLNLTTAINVVCNAPELSKMNEDTKKRLSNLADAILGSDCLREYSNSDYAYLALAKLIVNITPQTISYFALKLFQQYTHEHTYTIENTIFHRAFDRERAPALCFLLSSCKDCKFDDFVDVLCNQYKCEPEIGGSYTKTGIISVIQSLVPKLNSEKLIKLCNFLFPYYQKVVKSNEELEHFRVLAATLEDIANHLPMEPISQPQAHTSEAKDNNIVTRDDFMHAIVKLSRETPASLLGCKFLILPKPLITNSNAFDVLQLIYNQIKYSDGQSDFQKCLKHSDNINQALTLLSNKSENKNEYLIQKQDNLFTRLILIIGNSCLSTSESYVSELTFPISTLILKLFNHLSTNKEYASFLMYSHFLNFDKFGNQGTPFLIQVFAPLISQSDTTKTCTQLKWIKDSALSCTLGAKNWIDALSLVATLHKQTYLNHAYPMLQKHIYPDPVVDIVCEYLDSTTTHRLRS